MQSVLLFLWQAISQLSCLPSQTLKPQTRLYRELTPEYHVGHDAITLKSVSGYGLPLLYVYSYFDCIYVCACLCLWRSEKDVKALGTEVIQGFEH